MSGLLAQIAVAREFNTLFGGAFVAPWEVDDLPEEWHIARVSHKRDLAQMQAATQKIEQRKAEIRARHQRGTPS